ncbi:MAG: chorismate synthase [Lachnospiraceae bacterium]|nr:chorismate synthase [Lachnospiraceae bacterium]
MAGSIFGKLLQISTFGESHGPALGVVIDGFPAGVRITPGEIQEYLDRRKPGRSEVSTARNEADRVEILSGILDGITTGTPIAMLIRNTDQHSADYEELKNCYRPGHADYGFERKYGFRDHRGGGRSSGRETAARVAAGALCRQLLKQLGIDCYAYTASIGPVHADPERFDRSLITKTATAMPDREADAEAMAYIAGCREELDSVGGTVVCLADHVPAGLGDPVFDKLDARLSYAVMSVGAVKAVEIGDGVQVSERRGSENNDAFLPERNERGDQRKKTNHAGGILGGISDGSQIVIRAHFKPTPSIAGEQETVNRDGEPVALRIRGRHDPVIVPRAVVVVESMCAITILDALLLNMTARADRIEEFYRFTAEKGR